MKVLGIEKRDVYVALEFSILELKMLKGLSDHAIINYDQGDPFMKSAVDFLKKELEPQLEEFAKAFFGDD